MALARLYHLAARSGLHNPAASLGRSFTSAAAAPLQPAKRLGMAEVQHIVAVASGKGGVGKSTVAGAWARVQRAPGAGGRVEQRPR